MELQYLYEKRYLRVTSHPNDSALFIRFDGFNRLYFTKNARDAVRVLDTLNSGGRDALQAKCATDLRLWKQWEDMSNLGLFFSESAPPPLFSLALEVDSTLPAAEMAELYAGFCSIAGLACPLRVRIAPNDILAEVGKALSSGLVASLPIPLQEPFAKATTPLIRFITGGESVRRMDDDLVGLLDSRKVSVSFNYDLSLSREEREERLAIVWAYEDEGFQFPFEIPVSTGVILDRASHKSIASEICCRIDEAPSRNIDLTLLRPAVFESEEEIRTFYDSIDHFLESLYECDCNIAQLSVFKNYLCGILLGRFVSNRITFRPNGAGLDAYLPGSNVPLLRCDGSETSLRASFERIRSIFLDEVVHSQCHECPYYFFCPKMAVQPYLSMTSPEQAALRQLVFQRETRLHCRYFERFLEHLFLECDDNMKHATPLRLSITEDKELSFQPLYPTLDGGPRRSGGHSDDVEEEK